MQLQISYNVVFVATIIGVTIISIINYIVYNVHKESSCEMKQVQDRLKP